jgi:hypothetical protein
MEAGLVSAFHGIIETAAGQVASLWSVRDGKNGWSEFILKLEEERQPALRTSCNPNGSPNIDYVLRQ